MNIGELLKDPKKAKELLEKAIEDRDKELAEILIPVIKSPYLTFEYAKNIARGKIKDEWEDIIVKSSFYAYLYADFLKSPFPKGEEAIATNVEYSYLYAKNIIKGRFPKGEKLISKDPYYAYLYAKDVINGPWPEGEDAIAKKAEPSYGYARQVLKDRFIKGEKAIINKGYYLRNYMEFLKQIGKLDEFLKDHSEVKV